MCVITHAGIDVYCNVQVKGKRCKQTVLSKMEVLTVFSSENKKKKCTEESEESDPYLA